MNKFVLVAFSLVAGFMPASVLAADLPQISDDQEPDISPKVEIVDDASTCWYGRLGGGTSYFTTPKVNHQGSSPKGEKFKNSGFFEAGFGCQVHEHFRLEAMAGYHFRTKLYDKGQNDPLGGQRIKELNAKLTSYTGFANAYWDIVSLGGFTPYLGGGVGVAHHRITRVKLPNGAKKGHKTQFAYNLQAGVSYDLNEAMKIDIGYQFSDLGKAQSGGDKFVVKNIRAHEVKIGFRYNFGW